MITVRRKGIEGWSLCDTSLTRVSILQALDQSRDKKILTNHWKY